MSDRERLDVLRSVVKYVMNLAGDDRDFSGKQVQDVLGARDEREATVLEADALRRRALVAAGVIERPATWGGRG